MTLMAANCPVLTCRPCTKRREEPTSDINRELTHKNMSTSLIPINKLEGFCSSFVRWISDRKLSLSDIKIRNRATFSPEWCRAQIPRTSRPPVSKSAALGGMISQSQVCQQKRVDSTFSECSSTLWHWMSSRLIKKCVFTHTLTSQLWGGKVS